MGYDGINSLSANISKVHVGNAFFGGVGRAAEEVAVRNRSNVLAWLFSVASIRHSVFTTNTTTHGQASNTDARRGMRVAHDNRGKETALPVLVENRRWKHYGARILSNGRPRSYLYASAYSLCSAVCFSRQPLFYNRQTNYREYFFAAVKFLFVNKFYSANDIFFSFFFFFSSAWLSDYYEFFIGASF